MSINWLVNVPTPRGIDIPTYGNYGGPGYSNGQVLQPGQNPAPTAPPVDRLDALFRAHDIAYNSTSTSVRAEADLELIRGIAELPSSALSAEAHLYAGAATLAFIDQIVRVYRRPDLFEAGERNALTQNAFDNLRKGNIDPEANEIAAVPDRLADLLDYAGVGELGLGDGGDNVLTGSGDKDVLVGRGGNDTLIGLAGSDYLLGNEGSDTAVFSGLFRGYTVSGSVDSRTVSSGAEGTDNLESVETLEFADGRLVSDLNDPAAIVYRMYDAALGRKPDVGGFNHCVEAVKNGMSADTLAGIFAGSREFQSKYGNLSNQDFVEQLYLNALGRKGEAAGVEHWTNTLDSGQLSRAQVLAGFSESAEHIGQERAAVQAGLWDIDEGAASIARLYYAAFDRRPDEGGALNWINALESGRSLADIADAFVFSGEFQSKYGNASNEQFVEHLYVDVLNRRPDEAGFNNWVNGLNSGNVDKGDVVLGFAESLELQAKTINFINNGLLFA